MKAHENHDGDLHSPDPEFIDDFERELERTMRRVSRLSTKQLLEPRHLARTVAGMAALVIVSIFLGAFGTYTAVQMDDRLDRELAAERTKMELEMAQLRVQFIEEAHAEMKKYADASVISSAELDQYEQKLQMAQLHLQGAELNVQETKLSGRSPNDSLGAPLVEGKDFVTERLKLELNGRMVEAQRMEKQLDRVQQLVDAGHVSSRELSQIKAQLQTAELQAREIDKRIQLRRSVLAGAISAAEAELRAQRQEIESRLRQMQVQLNATNERLQRTRQLVERGLTSESELRETEFRQRELELQTRLAMKELEIIDQRISLHEQSREGG